MHLGSRGSFCISQPRPFSFQFISEVAYLVVLLPFFPASQLNRSTVKIKTNPRLALAVEPFERRAKFLLGPRAVIACGRAEPRPQNTEIDVAVRHLVVDRLGVSDRSEG